MYIKKIKRHWLSIGFICLCYQPLHAEAWFTGPLIAPAGQVLPLGHINPQLFGYKIKNIGNYDASGHLLKDGHSLSKQINPFVTYGLTDKMDMQFSIPYSFNQGPGVSIDQTDPENALFIPPTNVAASGIGDTSVGFGYQVLTQDNHQWRPDLRVTLIETIPTGHFEQLDPTKNGTDGIGSGTYQTQFAMNFQHLTKFNDINYLTTYLSFGYLLSQPTTLHGLSSYGGTGLTIGKLQAGDLYSVDLATEFSLTQHWGAVMEIYYTTQKGAHFIGEVDPNDATLSIGDNHQMQTSLAPAIEYNFSEHYGIILGEWFTIAGKNTPAFTSTVLLFNVYF